MSEGPTSKPTEHSKELPPMDSKKLLGPKGEVVILHDGDSYILRRTKQGKLVLHKNADAI